MRKKKPFIESQDIKVTKGNTGAYERWIESHGQSVPKGKLGDKFDFVTEDLRANPDSLREDEAMYSNSPLSRPQEIMGEAIEHLQGRQKDVYMLTMRQGMSINEAAKLLDISKSTAQVHRDRAIKFIAAYCQIKLTKEE